MIDEAVLISSLALEPGSSSRCLSLENKNDGYIVM